MVSDTRPHRLLVAISGCTSSGKTSLALSLAEVFRQPSSKHGTTTVDFFRQDNYFRPTAKCAKAVWAKISIQSNMDGQAQPISINSESYREQSKLIGPGGMVVTKVQSENGFLPSKLGHKLNSTTANYCLETNAIQFVDPKWVMLHPGPESNSESVFELNLDSSPFCKSSVEYRRATNFDCSDAIEWHGFSIDLNEFRLGNKISQRTSWEDSSQRRAEPSSMVRQQLRRLGILGWIQAQGLRMEVKKALLEIMDDNKAANFDGRYVRNGAMDLGILEGCFLFLEDRNGMMIEKLMKAADVKIFLQVTKKEAQQRHSTRLEYYFSLSQTKEFEKIWEHGEYFDNVAWPEYVSAHRWIFADGDIERDVATARGEELLSHKAVQLGVKCYSNTGLLNNVLISAVRQILETLKMKEKRWRDEFIDLTTEKTEEQSHYCSAENEDMAIDEVSKMVE